VGRVVPATVEPVTLKAMFRDPLSPDGHNVVEGEVEVGKTLNLMSIGVVPHDPTSPAEATEAIGRADQLILGPGSLFTSVLAVLAVPAINEAVAEARGRKVYVANLGEQHPETTGFDVADHLRALRVHGVEVDVVVTDPGGLEHGDLRAFGAEVVVRPLATPSGRLHDPVRLAEALAELI
jgi:uncharacterized cofD-like protein